MELIVHIAPREDWERAQAAGVYCAESLDLQGFIHCSKLDQVIDVANQRYAGQRGLVLLAIDPGKLRAELRYEDCYDTGLDFPHIYGPLNLEAVVAVVDFQPGPNGTFTLPAGL